MRRGAVVTFIPSILLLLVAFAVGCAQEEYPASLYAAQHPGADAGALESPDASVEPSGPAVCTQTRAESLPARLVAMSASAHSSVATVLASDIFQRFSQVCGSCHGSQVDPPGQGGFQIATAGNFVAQMSDAILAHVTESVCPGAPNALSPNDPMPPCSSPNGATFSQRADGDPVKLFADLVTEWLQAGKPVSFTPPIAADDAGASPGGDGGAPLFVLTPQAGNAMTNIGNCIPSRALELVESDKSAALDAMFAGLQAKASGSAPDMIGLPEHLGDTDLFTLDSAALAQYGVVAYAPGYPLWSDNAGKLRYVRVPRGTSIRFDKTTQQFVIPPNTRFYKTFMKQIIDTDGSYRYRKIETRLIVSRPDTNNADGTVTQTALYGSYKWTDDESDAVLVQTPLRNGRPFSDTLFLYNTDEQLAADILQGQPLDPEEALLEARAARHYAIPSSQRCVQCHMGSASQSFVLGFTPLQINRRPVGTGGVIEATGPDELSQLQRFIDAGIVTGISSPADVLPLEQSQGSRAPRNDYELVAQGYMLGNCAHCHNPRGFPTVQNPVLKDVLDILPSATGGIFQFPLESYSPRIGRGASGSTPIPYITPSLVDLPRMNVQTGTQAPDIFAISNNPGVAVSVAYAPWRSLIYRNVDGAFAYVDDLALFPHMPFNTPGYDPRGKQIIGDWMVSIPAVRKNPQLVEYAYQVDGQAADNIGSPFVDSTPQPYVEVTPGAPGYDQAVLAAQTRLGILHSGVNPAVPLDPEFGMSVSRYDDPGETDDILDPKVLVDPICHPVPTPDPVTVGQYSFPLPDHPHWVNTDLTDPPGNWAPRQANWPTVLVEQQIPPLGGGCQAPSNVLDAYADQTNAVSLVQGVTLDQVRDYVTTPVPFGLWQVKSGCDFSSVPTVQAFAADRPHWMDVTEPPANAPVFTQTPGAAVFKMICINCHGPNADSNGRLAQNLATMTGGLAAVADFRNGLFGPPGAVVGQRNMDAVYGTLPADAAPSWTGVSVDDRAARYMAWMGLGGTTVNIPVELLQIVAVTKVLDQQRVIDSASLSANMLSQAKALCRGMLGPSFAQQGLGRIAFAPGPGHGLLDPDSFMFYGSLIRQNYDAELWLSLCALASPPPVHILTMNSGGNRLLVAAIENPVGFTIDDGAARGTMVPADAYPAATPVGNAGGGTDASLIACTTGNIATCNTWPWCIDDRTATADQSAWITANGFPTCPPPVKATRDACLGAQAPAGTCFGDDAANRWAVRGAINAGMSVFLYVQSIENSSPPPDYNQCELLQ
jgi:mono/diheme cytochrome c family protein